MDIARAAFWKGEVTQGSDETLPVGFAQLPGWEPAGASSAPLTGCSPLGRTAPPAPARPLAPDFALVTPEGQARQPPGG